MAAGRKKTPDQVKILRGTDQPCRMNDQKPTYTTVEKVPTSPKFLTKTGRKIWRTVTEQLISMKLMNVVNADLVAAYCSELSIYVDLTMDLLEEGYTLHLGKVVEVEGEQEIVYTEYKANPKRKMAADALSNAQRLSGEFGFTPASQSKIVAPLLGKKKDEFGEAFD